MAMGTGPIFAAEPDLPTGDDATVEVTEAPVVEVDEPSMVIDDPVETKDDLVMVTLEIDANDVPEPAENPGETPDADDLPDHPAGESPAGDETCELEADMPLGWDPAADRSGASRFQLPSGEVPVPVDCADLRDATDPTDPTDPEVADEAEDADAAPRSDNDQANPDQVTIVHTEIALPATDTGPEPSQVQIDARAAAFIALVLVFVAWSATQGREDSPTR